jgi:hypothetical protein
VRAAPVAAEVRAGPAGAGIDGDEAQVGGAHEEPVGAGPVARGGPVGPVGDAAAVVAGADGAQLEVRVMDPALGPGNRVERDDAVERRAERQRPARLRRQQDRRGVEAREGLAVGVAVELAGAVLPGDAQRADVAAVDQAQGGVVAAAGVTAVVAPAAIVGPRRRGEEEGDEQGRDGPHGAGRGGAGAAGRRCQRGAPKR